MRGDWKGKERKGKEKNGKACARSVDKSIGTVRNLAGGEGKVVVLRFKGIVSYIDSGAFDHDQSRAQ